ncbi:hypothetical protein MASR2M36_39410 [Providencia sp.]
MNNTIEQRFTGEITANQSTQATKIPNGKAEDHSSTLDTLDLSKSLPTHKDLTSAKKCSLNVYLVREVQNRNV